MTEIENTLSSDMHKMWNDWRLKNQWAWKMNAFFGPLDSARMDLLFILSILSHTGGFYD